MLYHVRVTRKSAGSAHEYVADLTEAQVREQFVQPYEAGLPVDVNGKQVAHGDIAGLRVATSCESLREMVERLKGEESVSTIVVLPPYERAAFNRCDDVTSRFVRAQ